jgi:hypothetical protein
MMYHQKLKLVIEQDRMSMEMNLKETNHQAENEK